MPKDTEIMLNATLCNFDVCINVLVHYFQLLIEEQDANSGHVFKERF